MKKYTELCGKGGSKPFLELIKETDLKSPFDENVVKNLSEEIEEYIDSVDDSILWMFKVNKNKTYSSVKHN